MAIQLMSLPQVRLDRQNLLLDLAPINQGLATYQKGMGSANQENINKLIGTAYNSGGASGAAKEAAAQGRPEDAIQFENAGRQDKLFKQQSQDRAVKTLAGLSQMIQEAPEEQRPAMWQRIRALDKDTDADLTKMGIDPNDYMAATSMIIARAKGYQDPLARQSTEADIAYKQAQAQESLAKGEYYRSGGAQARAPKGYQYDDATGQYTFIPGGPADPEVIKQQSLARGRGKQFSLGDVNKLTDEGTKYGQARDFTNTFKDDYAGFTIPGGGSAAQWLGQTGMSAGYEPMAQWWRRYQQEKNDFRHSMFGASLTPGEAKEFDKGSIDPSLAPNLVRGHLQREEGIKRLGILRKSRALVASGYPAETIEQALGVPLDNSDLSPEELTQLEALDKELNGPNASSVWGRSFGGAEPKNGAAPGGAPTAGQQRGAPQQRPQAPVPPGPQGMAPENWSGAVNDLRSDPSPEAMREFDEAFGPGAAQHVLGQ
jgi:hypothetical protein